MPGEKNAQEAAAFLEGRLDRRCCRKAALWRTQTRRKLRSHCEYPFPLAIVKTSGSFCRFYFWTVGLSIVPKRSLLPARCFNPNTQFEPVWSPSPRQQHHDTILAQLATREQATRGLTPSFESTNLPSTVTRQPEYP